MVEETRRRGRPPRVIDEGEVVVPHWDDDLPTERVVVARGRTVLAPHPTETQIVRQGEDGRPVRAPISVTYEEGFEIELDKKEAERLISLGIVHKPGEPEIYPAALSEGSRVVELGPPRSPVNQAMRT